MATKQFSPAQLAAQAKFAAMVRAKAATRKRNPLEKADGNWKMDANAWREECNYIDKAAAKKGRLPAFNNSTAVFRRYCEGQRDSAERNGFYDAATCIQEIIDDLPATRKTNPLTRVKVNSPAQRSGAAPSKRLKARRKATAKAPAGYYANPIQSPKLAIKLNAGNDTNGNPRHGLLIVELIDGVEARYLGFVDIGYSGSGKALESDGYARDIPIVGVFNIPVREYQSLKRQGARWIKE